MKKWMILILLIPILIKCPVDEECSKMKHKISCIKPAPAATIPHK